MSKERNFTWDKEKTIKLGMTFTDKIVKEFMNKYNVNEFEARCSMAELYFDLLEDELIYKEMEKRKNQDNGIRYSLDEIEKIIK